MSNKDLGSLGRSYMRQIYHYKYVSQNKDVKADGLIWLFSDINDPVIANLLSISSTLLPLLYSGILTKKTKDIIRQNKDLITQIKDPNDNSRIITPNSKYIRRVDQEIRHASK